VPDDNPFAPSNAAASAGGDVWAQAEDLELLKADRFQRWVGAIVDGLLPLVIAVPLMVVGYSALDVSQLSSDELEGVFYLVYFFAMLPVSILNWVLIVQRGQSLGKMAVGTRIVTEGGAPVDFVKGVVVRNWVLAFGSAFCGLLGFIDAVMIFGDKKQCLHDMLAKTIVVNASSWNPYDT